MIVLYIFIAFLLFGVIMAVIDLFNGKRYMRKIAKSNTLDAINGKIYHINSKINSYSKNVKDDEIEYLLDELEFWTQIKNIKIRM